MPGALGSRILKAFTFESRISPFSEKEGYGGYEKTERRLVIRTGGNALIGQDLRNLVLKET